MTISKPVLNTNIALMGESQSNARKVLIIHSSEINLAMIGEMLARMGIEVNMAKSGDDIAAKALKTQYNVIIMDFSTLRADGPIPAEQIHELKIEQKHLEIIGVSSLNDANTNPYNTLFDKILTMPVGQAQLAAAIEATPPSVAMPDHSLAPRDAPTSVTGTTPKANVSFHPLNRTIENQDSAISTSFDEIMSLLGKDNAVQLLIASFSDVDLALSTMTDQSLNVADKTAAIHKSVGSTAILGLADLSEALLEAEKMTLEGCDPNLSELPKLISALLKEARLEHTPLIAHQHESAS